MLWTRSAAVPGQCQILGCDGSCCCCCLQTCPNCIVLAAFPPLTRVHRPSDENWKLLPASSSISSRISPCLFEPLSGHNTTLCYVLRSVYMFVCMYVWMYMHSPVCSVWWYGFKMSMYVHFVTRSICFLYLQCEIHAVHIEDIQSLSTAIARVHAQTVSCYPKIHKIHKMESALDVLSRAATMVQNNSSGECPTDIWSTVLHLVLRNI